MLAYDKLAEELKDKVNIVAVDCDAHRALCTKNGVKGFPTIKMYVSRLDDADVRLESGKSNEYSGARSLDKLKQFALKFVKPYVCFTTTLKSGPAWYRSNMKTLNKLSTPTRRFSYISKHSRLASLILYVPSEDPTDQ